jgi:hypothetical protein
MKVHFISCPSFTVAVLMSWLCCQKDSGAYLGSGQLGKNLTFSEVSKGDACRNESLFRSEMSRERVNVKLNKYMRIMLAFYFCLKWENRLCGV